MDKNNLPYGTTSDYLIKMKREILEQYGHGNVNSGIPEKVQQALDTLKVDVKHGANTLHEVKNNAVRLLPPRQVFLVQLRQRKFHYHHKWPP